MAKDLRGKRASVWHAYTALREQGKDKENAVAKGQLKVCTIDVKTHLVNKLVGELARALLSFERPLSPSNCYSIDELGCHEIPHRAHRTEIYRVGQIK